MRRTWPVLAVAIAIVGAAALLATRGDDPPTTLEERVQEVAAGLRCPVCQNLSVADSPSRLAGEMRDEIGDRLGAGATEDEVRAYFVGRYGEWVLLQPTRSGLNLLPWLFPFAAMAAGLSIWIVAVRRSRRGEGEGDEAVPEPVRQRIDRELDGLEEPT